MRAILSRSEMCRFDERAIQSGVPGIVLMENAGRGAVEELEKLVRRRGLLAGALESRDAYGERLHGLRAVVLCGAGNNGGDGYVVARRLLTLGARVLVLSAVPCASLKGDAHVAYTAFAALGEPVSEAVESARAFLAVADVAVDALLGTGATREVSGLFAELVAALNDAACPVVSLDIPSGLDADTGRVLGSAVRAALTVTFAHPKRGLFSGPGHDLCGELCVADIGVPGAVVTSPDPALSLERSDVAALVKKRSPAAHKGDSGRVVVVAGSEGKLGAARLAARGSLRGGAGLVTLLTQAEAARKLEQSSLEDMTERLDEADPAASLARFERVDAFVVGPGMGRDARARAVVDAVLARPEPVVLDADALHLVHNRLGTLTDNGPRVLTPHPGEAAMLLGISTREVEEDRFAAAERLAHISRAVVVLKGSRSLIAAEGHPVVVSVLGSPVLATGGTGDVLAGLLGACLVSRAPRDAALLAVGLHALAGERCARGGLDRGVLAHEIADAVPHVVGELLS